MYVTDWWNPPPPYVRTCYKFVNPPPPVCCERNLWMPPKTDHELHVQNIKCWNVGLPYLENALITAVAAAALILCDLGVTQSQPVICKHVTSARSHTPFCYTWQAAWQSRDRDVLCERAHHVTVTLHSRRTVHGILPITAAWQWCLANLSLHKFMEGETPHKSLQLNLVVSCYYWRERFMEGEILWRERLAKHHCDNAVGNIFVVTRNIR